MENLPVIILAGGMGTRLKDVIHDVPKPMAPVMGKPFLEYLVMQLMRWNIRDIVMSVGYKRDCIKDYFGDGSRWDVKIKYADEVNPLGTGGGIRNAAQFVDKGSFLVMNGDSYFDADLEGLFLLHGKKKSQLTVALVQRNDTGRYGKVEIDSEGRVIAFKEKESGTPGFINSGIYVMTKEFVALFPEGKSSFENDMMPRSVGRGVFGLPMEGFFIDIGVPEDYEKACSAFKQLR